MPDGAEREDLIRQTKDLLVSYMPFKLHVNNVYVDVVQP